MSLLEPFEICGASSLISSLERTWEGGIRAAAAYSVNYRTTASHIIAEHVEYHGSSEHKSYPSRAGPPALRTDATPCDPDIDWAAISNALAQGVRRGCISEATEQGLPKYVWAWLGGDLYEARHLNGFAGKYKGYRLEPPEYPRDSDRRLDWPAP